ncbi:unnamed protein product, partial [Hymenolepis diminuta]
MSSRRKSSDRDGKQEYRRKRPRVEAHDNDQEDGRKSPKGAQSKDFSEPGLYPPESQEKEAEDGKTRFILKFNKISTDPEAPMEEKSIFSLPTRKSSSKPTKSSKVIIQVEPASNQSEDEGVRQLLTEVFSPFRKPSPKSDESPKNYLEQVIQETKPQQGEMTTLKIKIKSRVTEPKNKERIKNTEEAKASDPEQLNPSESKKKEKHHSGAPQQSYGDELNQQMKLDSERALQIKVRTNYAVRALHPIFECQMGDFPVSKKLLSDLQYDIRDALDHELSKRR